MDSNSSRPNVSYERPSLPEEGTEDGGEDEIRPVWTTLMEEMLIHYIRANRLLWDPKHPHFTKRMLKRRKVEDIAAIIKREAGLEEDLVFSPEDVWRKFRNLRTSFVREVRKVNEQKRLLGDNSYDSKWVHFNRMLFLVDVLKKSIEANVPLPGIGTHPASIKLEGSRNRLPLGSLGDLSSLQEHHQETENELRIGGEFEAISAPGTSTNSRPPISGQFETTSAPGTSSNFRPPSALDRNCDRVISRSSSEISGPSAKKLKVSQSQEKKLAEVTDAFSRYILASIRRYPEDKQHALMADITQCISNFHKKQ